MDLLRERIEAVKRRIEAAARRAGRERAGITLIAVTKTFPASLIREAYEAGLRAFGENYIQEFERKRRELEGLAGARFHFIGHLQSNKARRAAELFDAVQTVDSAKLARRLNDAAVREVETMIEVKLSGEDAKAGASPAELPSLIEAVRACPNLRLTGLMTMPPWSEDPELSRPYFRRLRELANCHGVTGLSMGMSHDLEVAIEEGATHVRVGTALFGSRTRA
jgi:pyridoxal phosphate enzyme (YggS family)